MTLALDLLSALEDDESDGFKDVTLIGSDGGRVSATKAVLAIRSPVFRKMFFGEFREASAKCDSVQMNYSAVVLNIVVKYCYTDEIDLDTIVSEGSGNTGRLRMHRPWRRFSSGTQPIIWSCTKSNKKSRTSWNGSF